MKLLLVSHGGFAEGLADILNNFLGTGGVSFACVTLEGGVDHLTEGIDEFLAGVDEDEQVIVCSDIMGGSANQNAYARIATRPNTYLVAGMNLPLVLQINLRGTDLTADELREMIEESKQGIVLVNDLLASADEDDE